MKPRALRARANLPPLFHRRGVEFSGRLRCRSYRGRRLLAAWSDGRVSHLCRGASTSLVRPSSVWATVGLEGVACLALVFVSVVLGARLGLLGSGLPRSAEDAGVLGESRVAPSTRTAREFIRLDVTQSVAIHNLRVVSRLRDFRSPSLFFLSDLCKRLRRGRYRECETTYGNEPQSR